MDGWATGTAGGTVEVVVRPNLLRVTHSCLKPSTVSSNEQYLNNPLKKEEK
jgi:hypothetical protein